MTKEQIKTIAAQKGLRASGYSQDGKPFFFLRNRKKVLLLDSRSLDEKEARDYLQTLPDLGQND